MAQTVERTIEQNGDKRPSVREKLVQIARRKVNDAIETGSVSMPSIANEAIQELLLDPADLQEWLGITVRPVMYEHIQREVAKSRNGVIIFGDTLTTPAEVKNAARRRRPNWQVWVEHAGDRSVPLTLMTRTDLEIAANEREKRGLHELKLASLWRHMAYQLSGSQKVSDLFTPEQIQSLADELNVDWQAVRQPSLPV
jgi:hypothetical protein